MALRSWLVPVCGLLLLPVGPGRLLAVAPVVHDDAKFFSADAVKKANEVLHDIASKSERDLLVETFLSVPPDQVEKVKAMDREERARYFLHWAEERADANVVRGVYVLVCKEPAHLEVYVTPKVRAQFDKETRQKLIDQLLKDFHEKQYDDGLLKAAKFVLEKFAAKPGQ